MSSIPAGTKAATQKQNTAGGAEVQVSVIIPALNEEKVIGRCLEALRQVELGHVRFEVIIVDNGSKDDTTRVALGFTGSLDLRILEKKGVTISALRNLGASEARGEIFAFLDADCLPPADWLTRALSLLKEKSQRIIGARYRIPENSSWIARAWFQDRETKHAELVSYVPSGNLIVSRSNFQLIGGFDEQLETNEDFDFCQRARIKGLQILACPEIAVVHLGTPQRLGEFYMKQRWHGTHVFRVFLRGPQHRQNARVVAFTLYMFACLALCFAGVVPMCMGHPILFLAAFAASLVAPVLASLTEIIRGKELRYFCALILLYAAFGVARCASLLSQRSWQSATKTKLSKVQIYG